MEIRLSRVYERVISLVPSITELLWDLGLEDEVVGITKFCIRPEHWYHEKPRIGGTKTVHVDRLLALNPDLLIANKEENDRDQVGQLAGHVPVWTSDVSTISDALVMITSIGQLLRREDRSQALIAEIEEGLTSLQDIPRRKAIYLVWNQPSMVAGSDTFIHSMMEVMGFTNVVEAMRYPTMSDTEIIALNPDVLLLPSEPFPFAEKHLAEFQQRFPTTPAVLVDGEMFSWYGSRMKHVAGYARELQQQL